MICACRPTITSAMARPFKEASGSVVSGANMLGSMARNGSRAGTVP